MVRLVFIHAAGSSGDEWVQQRLALAARHAVVTPDLPGHGRSTETPLRRIEDMADWAYRTQSAGDAVLVGHSMGAAVAIALAARHPVGALVLVGAARRLRVPDGFLERVSRDAGAAVERLAASGFARGTRAALVEKASAYLARTDPAVLAADFAASAAFDAGPYLSGIRAPALVVAGAEDRMTTPDDAREIASGIPGAELEVLAGAGHMVMLERPRAFNERLLRFVERVA